MAYTTPSIERAQAQQKAKDVATGRATNVSISNGKVTSATSAIGSAVPVERALASSPEAKIRQESIKATTREQFAQAIFAKQGKTYAESSSGQYAVAPASATLNRTMIAPAASQQRGYAQNPGELYSDKFKRNFNVRYDPSRQQVVVVQDGRQIAFNPHTRTEIQAPVSAKVDSSYLFTTRQTNNQTQGENYANRSGTTGSSNVLGDSVGMEPMEAQKEVSTENGIIRFAKGALRVPVSILTGAGKVLYIPNWQKNYKPIINISQGNYLGSKNLLADPDVQGAAVVPLLAALPQVLITPISSFFVGSQAVKTYQEPSPENFGELAFFIITFLSK